MPSGTPESQVEWLSLSCPLCKVRLRIRAAYPHLRGRCPECAVRIEAPRPRARASQAGEADGLEGLLPVDEEWPESARLEEDASPYGFGAAHARPALPPPPPPPAVEGYALASGRLTAAAPPPVAVPAPSPYAVSPAAPLPLPSTTDDAGYVRHAGLMREEPPPPPAWPLWEGIYTFPWRLDNLGVWLALAMGFGLLAVLAATALGLFEAGGVALVGIVTLIPVMAIVGICTGTFAAGSFLTVVEQTASGNDRVSWPRGAGIGEGLGRLAYMVWVCGCCAPVAAFPWLAAAVAAPEDSRWWLVSLVPWTLVFPLVLLSSLSAGSPWILLEGKTLAGFVKRPGLVLVLCLASLALLTPATVLGYRALTGVNLLAAAGCGPLWAAAFLIYARLLGRVGWVLTHEPSRKRGRGNPPREAEAADDAGE